MLINLRIPIFAAGIQHALTEQRPDWCIEILPGADHIAALCREKQPDALLLEVLPRESWTIEQRLGICQEIRQTVPTCKLCMMVNEDEKKLVEATIQAKQNGQIDAFVFEDISSAYLAAVIDCL